VKAKYSGRCNVCRALWGPGDELEKLMGKLVHPNCKAAELASRVDEGARTVLPEARGTADMKTEAIKIRKTTRNYWVSRNNPKS